MEKWDFTMYTFIIVTIMYIQEIGEKLSEIGSRLDYPHLNKELAQEIETLWKDGVIQVIFS